MALLDIVLMGDPVLRREAEDVETFDDELRRLVDDMFETMYHAEGVGLAAPQVGLSRRVLVVDTRADDDPSGPIALVNPSVVRFSDETDKDVEGCLSIPGIEDSVERPERVEVEARDPHGAPVRIEADGLLSRVLQHEIDHLDGVLFLDRISPLKRKLLLGKWKKLRSEAEKTTARS